MYAQHEQTVEAPWLTIVGVGEDGWTGLSAAARTAIERAEFVIGGERHLALLPDVPGQERQCWPSPFLDAIDGITARHGRPTCVLASGDPFWYGVGVTLARRVDAREMQVFAQSSAFSMAAARMGWALQHTTCLSVHGREQAKVARYLQDGARILILSWDGQTPATMAGLLVERGFGGSQLTVLEHMDGQGEQRISAVASEWSLAETEALNTIAVDCVADTPSAAVPAVAGRHESRFEHDGQISKGEMRAVVLSLLAPRHNEHLWDVGAGSGAVAIEWMLAGTGNRTTAIEARAARVEHIRANAARFGVPRLACVQGRAPGVLGDLEPPDAVFLGGGLTSDGLLERCLGALQHNPRGRLVATSVTVEGNAVLTNAMRNHGGALQQVQINDAEPLGQFLGWTPRRPVTVWHWRNDKDER